MPSLQLPDDQGRLSVLTLRQPRDFPPPGRPFSRIAFSAAHVVPDPLRPRDPRGEHPIDWDATLDYRRYLWSLGLGVAEAMDTAQRGMGLSWPQARELIRRSAAAARDIPGARIASGAGTDHLPPDQPASLKEIVTAYEEQCAAIEAAGSQIILMASRALARTARGPDDYAAVYGHILSNVRGKVILHWLGDMFDPRLHGYWGSADPDQAAETVLRIIAAHRDRIDGIKVSLLDRQREIDLRARLPRGVRMYTGDDYNYADLIADDAHGRHSDALLGIFDAIAPAAAAALGALSAGDMAAFHDILEPTVPLSRLIFEPPTRFYKTGVVFMAYLNGHQSHFSMLGGMESARSVVHLSNLFRLANAASLLRDPDLCCHRMKLFLSVQGGIA
ncbi:dihydrodipicolinate synthase family protein [Gluconacetobacter sacchari]|uniref:dihydrodipicolinate synthase family protein n=1 Tax=Gluconacetobacter sacchari TaxID=92759 RepID=UPI0039B6DE7A